MRPFPLQKIIRCKKRKNSCQSLLSRGASANASLSIVLEALLGNSVRPRGPSPWTERGFLSTHLIRGDPQHILNRANDAVQRSLVAALNERQPFLTSEQRLLAQRTQLSSHVGAPSPTSSSSAPVLQWFTWGVRHLSSSPRVALGQRWDDWLFPLLQHDAFRTSDAKQLTQAIAQVVSLVTWQVDRLLHDGIGTDESPATFSLVSPRWARKLRKMICEQGAKGGIVAFAEQLMALWDAEARLHRPTALTSDVELLQFLVTIPCRKDSSLNRSDIAAETMRYLDFSCTRMWRARAHNNPMEQVQLALSHASNAVVFAQNDGNEAERLRTVFVSGAAQTLSFGDTHIAAELLSSVLEAALKAAHEKCRALQYTAARSFATVLCEVTVAQDWIHEQVRIHGVPSVLVADALSMIDGLPAQVAITPARALRRIISQIESFLVEMAKSLRVPTVFDRIVDDVTSIVDGLLQPIGLLCGRLRALVVAVGSVAPRGSSWALRGSLVESQGVWRCGCGEDVLLSLNVCPKCTVDSMSRSAEGDAAPRYQCTTCASSVEPGTSPTPSCRTCGAAHPIVAAALSSNQWHCLSCATSMPLSAPACPSCHTTNPLEAAVCKDCGYRNHTESQRCELCGCDVGASTAETPPQTPRIQWCSSCSSLSEVPTGSTSLGEFTCTRCVSREIAANGRVEPRAAPVSSHELVQSHQFQWKCGCGAWSSALDRRCHRCCPVATRNGKEDKFYVCPSCSTVCGRRHVTMQALAVIPHLKRGPVMNVASCGGCGVWHPRDMALLTASRLVSCPSCDSVLPIRRLGEMPQQCPRCSHEIEQRSAQSTAVVDLPWVCHACGGGNSNLQGDETSSPSAHHGGEALTFCGSCHAERPSPLVFSPNTPWVCSSCSEPTRGNQCETCGIVSPHLPRSEVLLWRCAGCEEWNHSWEGDCSSCHACRTLDAPRAHADSWACNRCKVSNGPLLKNCWHCGDGRRVTERVLLDATEALRQARDVLLLAASESCAHEDSRHALDISLVETIHATSSSSDLGTSEVDSILSRMHFL